MAIHNMDLPACVGVAPRSFPITEFLREKPRRSGIFIELVDPPMGPDTRTKGMVYVLQGKEKSVQCQGLAGTPMVLSF